MKAQFFTQEEVEQHQKRGDVWFTMNGKVYDVSSFLEDHPGGEDIFLEQAGHDATVAFEDVGHSTSARKLADTFYIGELVEKDDPRWQPKEKCCKKNNLLVAGSIVVAGLAVASYIYQRAHK